MQIVELWSVEDDARLDAFRRAVEYDDLCGALLAIEGVAPHKAEAARAQIQIWGDWVAAEMRTRSVGDPASALAHVLSAQLDFRGDEEDYHHPDNSRLTVVSRRRRGLPILLSAVWALVAERAGVEAHGIGMPGHFILRLGGPEGTLVDPFNRGQRLSVEACQQIVGQLLGDQVSWDDRFLEPIDLPAWVERVLRNLVASHHRADEMVQLYQTTRFLVALRPDQPETIMLHGRLAEEVGAHGEAMDIYTDAMQRFSGTAHAQQAARRRAEVATRLERLN